MCAIGWSLAYPLIKAGYGYIGIGDDLGSKVVFAGIRFFFAGLILLIAGRVFQDDITIPDFRTGAAVFIFALVNTTLHYLFSYIGLAHLPSSRSTILDSMGGFFLILLSGLLFQDDRFTWRKAVGCLLGLGGIIVMNLSPSGMTGTAVTFMGDGMILLNAFCAAAGGIMTRMLSRQVSMTAATAWSMLTGGAVLLLMGVFLGIHQVWQVTGMGIAITAGLVLISAVCFEIYNLLLSFHPISQVAIFNAFIPILGVLFSVWLLQEPMKWQYITAGLLVMAGVFQVNWPEPLQVVYHKKEMRR